MKPPQSRKLELSQDELNRVAAARAKNEATKVDENWLFIAEFGFYYGWDGIQAILNNEITMDVANTLLAGARKVWSGRLYDHSMASFIGASSAQAKKPNQIFKKATRDIVKHARADS